MQRRELLKASGVVGSIGLTAGCLTGGGGGGGPIVIGAIEPLSGPFEAWGKVHRDGIEFAVKEINDEGGIMNRDVELRITDTKSAPDEADSASRRFVEQENAVVLTGPVSSDVGINTAQTAQDLEVPLLLHMAGSDEVITPETTYTFRVGLLPATSTMKAQAQLVEDLGFTKIGGIIADYAWGQSIKKGIENEFPVDVNIRVAPLGANDFKSHLRKMPDDLEMMIATGHPPGTFTIAKQQFQLGLEPKVTTGPGFPPGVIRNAMGETVTQGMTHLHNTDIYTQEFAEVASRYAEETGKLMDTHTAYGYVTGNLIAQGIENAGSDEPTEIRNALRDINFDTLFARPIQYSDHGELKNQMQIYSAFSLDPPSYFEDANYSLTEVFRSDQLPALPPEK